MPGQYLHGAEVIEVANGARPIRVPASAIIGLVGAAPQGPVNVPTLVFGSLKQGLDTFGPAGYGWSIPDALKAIYTVAEPLVVVINVADPGNSDLLTDVSGSTKAFDITGKIKLAHPAVSSVVLTGPVTAPATFSGNSLVLPTGATSPVVRSADGNTTYTVTTDYTYASHTLTIVNGGAMVNDQAVLITYSMSGIASPADYTVDAANGVLTIVAGAKLMPRSSLTVAYNYLDPTKVTDNLVTGSVSNDQYTGVYALLGAETVTSVRPRLLIAPGFTSDRPGNPPAANPTVAALSGIADRTKSIAIVDGPNTTDDAAISYRNDWGSKRIYMVDPSAKWQNPVTGTIEAVPASPYVAALFAKIDTQKGFWFSPSNNVIDGIVGTGRPIDFQMGDPACRANVLNADEIATIIHRKGFKLWGDRTCSTDPQWAFVNVVRTADMIGDGLLDSIDWAVDNNITKKFVESVVESVKAYLALLKELGAIIDGTAWADPDLNTPETIASGQLYIDFDFAPAYPAEHITFREQINNSYLTEIFGQGSV